MTITSRHSRRQTAPAVWIVAPFLNLSLAADGGRYGGLARQVQREGAVVTVFTSAFDHYTKRRKPPMSWHGLRFVSVYEPGYRSNVSLRRIASHLVFDLCLLGAGLWTAAVRGRDGFPRRGSRREAGIAKVAQDILDHQDDPQVLFDDECVHRAWPWQGRERDVSQAPEPEPRFRR